jgi:branched-subunit amino acid aminotransferase/4-amino-4-deoxychorismate lyase
MQGLVWRDGEFCEESACVPIDARGFMHGLGVFETMLAVDGQVVASVQHFKRLEASCGRLGLLLQEGLLSAIESLLKRKGRQRVRLQVSAGVGALNQLAGGPEIVTLIISDAEPSPDSASAVWSPWPRNERSPLVGLKCASYAENLLALDLARQSGVTTALFLNTRRELCEAATANLFIVSRGVIRTPSLNSGCLPGTARARVFDVARMLGVKAEEAVLNRDDLEAADEIFLTSATQGVVPLTKLEGDSIDVGQVTRSLREVFNGK